MIDLRAQLKRSSQVQQVNRTATRFITIHYNGPSVEGIPDDVRLLKADAAFHVNTRGWDGLAYHYAVGRDGTLYQTRDYEVRLNHSGVPLGNSESLAVFVATGEGDVLPVVQVTALEQLIQQLAIHPRYVLGHQEWPRATACPGAKLMRWLNGYRQISSGERIEVTSKYLANVRDEPSILSHQLSQLPVGTRVHGIKTLGKPVKGDSLWVRLNGTQDYVHASALGI